MKSNDIKSEIIKILQNGYPNTRDKSLGNEIGNNDVTILVDCGNENLESFPSNTYKVETEISLYVYMQNSYDKEKQLYKVYDYVIQEVNNTNVNTADTIYTTNVDKGEYSDGEINYDVAGRYNEMHIWKINLMAVYREYT